jgi:hypothetical protein
VLHLSLATTSRSIVNVHELDETSRDGLGEVVGASDVEVERRVTIGGVLTRTAPSSRRPVSDRIAATWS